MVSETTMSQPRRKALFDEGNAPPGGVCLSSFVLVKRGEKILVGKMTKPEIWIERFFVGEKFAPTYANSNKYLLPARHLAWYESPLDAAAGVLRNQLRLRVPKKNVRLLDVQSHLRGDVMSTKEPPHWDICFVYETELSAGEVKRLKTPPWFKDLQFVSPSSLAVGDFTRSHGDILEEAGVIK